MIPEHFQLVARRFLSVFTIEQVSGNMLFFFLPGVPH
jgi:hypothetical protein